MIFDYKNNKLELLRTGNVKDNKDFVELWLNNEQIINLEKENDEIKLVFYKNNKEIYEIPLYVFKKAIQTAEEFIED